MNYKTLENIVSFYKKNYKKIENKELYKWQAFQTFHDNWDLEADDFYEMLEKSLIDISNLMSASQYYPKRMILWMAEKNEEAVRKMFEILYDPGIPLEDRMKSFKAAAKELVEKYKEKNVHHTYQDDRAIMVYLSLRYPEKYYLYKFKMFKEFANFIDYDWIPKSGHVENLFRFESLCNMIKNYIMQDVELMELYKPRKEKYYDPEYHLLVQDIIYTINYMDKPEFFEEVQIVEPTEFAYQAIQKDVILEGKAGVDYIEEEKKKKEIGDLGEQFIYDQECANVKKYKLSKSKKVEWVSKDKGDGWGYDILSYDEHGKEMYIEVKTTLGAEDTSFFISANELKKSKQCAENYYLYRVFEFDRKKGIGKYSIRRGSLEGLCLVPIGYRVHLK